MEDPCFFRNVEAEEKPSKKSKKGGAKWSVALFEGVYTIGCVSQDSSPTRPFDVKKEHWDQNTPSNSPRAPGTNFYSGKKGSIVRKLPERSPCPAKFGRNITWGDLAPRKMRLQCSVGFGRKHLQAQECRQSYVLYSCWSKDNAATCFEKTRGAKIRSRFREHQMHMMSKKDLSSDELDTLRRSRILLWYLSQWRSAYKTRRYKFSFTI